MDIFTIIGLFLLGIGIGFLSGLFGFGGSSISTPLLRIIFNIPPMIALGSPLPMTIFSASIATAKYHREGLVDWRITAKMIVTFIPGAVLGAYSTRYIPGKILMVLTAFFIIYTALKFLTGWERRKNVARKEFFYLAGFVIGLVSGMLANGGGVLFVPILFLMGIRMKRAIGTSLAVVLLGAIPSVLVHWYLGHIDPMITLLLTLGVMPFSYLGARVSVKMKSEKLKRYYGLFLLLLSLYFLAFEILEI